MASGPDYSQISIDSLNCDKCAVSTLNTEATCNAESNCVWVPDNTGSSGGGSCMDKCKARVTKGECEQYHEWNRTRFTPTIYDFDGSDNRCHWHPHPHSVDDTPDSIEGDCRAKSKYTTTVTTPGSGSNPATTTTTTVNNYCFEECPAGSSTCNGGTCHTFADGVSYCVPLKKETLGDIYCGDSYSGHFKGCNTLNGNDNACKNRPDCEIYQDPRYLDFPASTPEQDKGICVSDGTVTYDLTTGKSKGLLMTDEQCNKISDSKGCMNYMGQGCLWEPFNKFCIPKVDKTSDDTLFNSCKEITGHVPANYDINMIEEEHKNVSEFRDRENIKYPYITSKYLCDVCHIRDQDLDTMKSLSSQAAKDKSIADKLKYFMIATMATTVAFTYFATGNEKAALWTGGFMILVAIYCWRYPSTVEEYDRRKAAGEKIAWFK